MESPQLLNGETGSVVFTTEEVAVDHFSKVFTTEEISNLDSCPIAIPRMVSDDLNQKLCANITNTKIKAAIDGLGSLKSPDPDGFNGLFFKSH
ncbi:hypothetical protein SESBI_26852 [Sesbania bispinosa]|nr:hypothetical protein SESBI_26852 [Sesbania bispinosa]